MCIRDSGFADKVFNNKKFDLIIANILPKPLISLSSGIKEHLTKSDAKSDNKLYDKLGKIILSGFTQNYKDDVLDSYAQHNLQPKQVLEKNTWLATILGENF